MRKPAVIGTFLVLCCVSLIFGAMSLQKLGEQTNNGKGVAIAIVVLVVLLGLGLGGQHKLRAIFILAIIVSILLQVIPNTSVIIEDTRPQRGGETRENEEGTDTQWRSAAGVLSGYPARVGGEHHQQDSEHTAGCR